MTKNSSVPARLPSGSPKGFRSRNRQKQQSMIAPIGRKANRWGWIFVSVSILMISLLVFFPMVQAFWLSLQKGMGNQLSFAGFENYSRLFTDTTFRKALGNTFLYLVIQVPVMLLLAIILSVMLNDPKLKFRTFFRIAIFLPCVTSLVSYSLIMKSIFSGGGLVNQVLLSLNAITQPIGWTTNPAFARALIIISITWRWTGYNMIFFLSGMQNIEPSVYEAADLDGCGPVRRLWSITIPQLKPIVLFTSITSTIGTLQLFDEVQNITNGGPANATITISQYIYNLCFKYNPNFGYAAAVAFVVLILIALLSAIQLKLGGDR